VTQTPADWYPDPNDARQLRYWDGSAWTAHVAAALVPALPTGPTTPDGEPLAGWWWRVLAYVIDPLWATWDSKRQTLHDKLAANVVRPL
jgi:hypothetical protein